MRANDAFQRVNERGWKRGLRNLLRSEMGGWWKTSAWRVQALSWTAIINIPVATLIWGPYSEGTPSGITLYAILASIFPTIAVIIILQDAIIGEKESGTAAWVMSKPASHTAFIVAKLIAHSFGVFVTMTLLPGIVAYIQISLASGAWLSLLNFFMGIVVIWLYQFFFLTLTLMLGVLYDQRGAVAGPAFALAFGSQMLLLVLPVLNFVLPWRLAIGTGTDSLSVVESVILGTPPFSWLPVISVASFAALFIAVAIRKFHQQEL